MNKKILSSSVILFTATLGLIAASVGYVENPYVSLAEGQMIDDSSFVSVENFAFSGKGISMEFTFAQPAVKKTNTFSFMHDWDRLTTRFTMTFNTDGKVDCTIGKVYKFGENYVFQLMLADLQNYLNKSPGEEADGTETLNSIYINDCNVHLDVINTTTIESTINLYPEAEIRDAYLPGLKFRAFVPSFRTTIQYGMVIAKYEDVALCDVGTDYITYLTNNSLEFLDLECKPSQIKSSDPFYSVYGAGYSFQASITHIKQDNYYTEFVAIPYEMIGGGIKYGNMFKSAHTNYYDTCVKMKNSSSFSSLQETTKTEINNVIYKCENHTLKLQTTNVKAYFAENTDNIIKHRDLLANLELKGVMSAAKNEKESGQLVLHVEEDIQKKFYVNFEPFVNEDRTQVIPSSNVSISKQMYQNVKSNWRIVNDQKNTGWYPNDYVEGDLPLGYYPDALLPFEDAVYSKENILTNIGGGNNAISFTINVPKDIKAGLYTSKIVIRIEDEGNIVLPVELTVHDFTLPDENKFVYNIIVNTSELKALYGDSGSSMDSPYYQAAYNLLKENGVSGGSVPATYWSENDTDNYIAKLKELAVDPKISNYFLPNSYEPVTCDVDYTYKTGTIIPTTKTETVHLDGLSVYCAKDTLYGSGTSSVVLPGLESRLEAIARASTNEVNLFKKGVFYFPQSDEPGNRKDKAIQNILCENVLKRSIEYVSSLDIFDGKEEVKQAMQNLKFVVTSYPRELLNGGLETITKIYNCSSSCSLCYCNSANEVKYRHLTGYCPTYESFQTGIKKDMGRDALLKMIDDPEYKVWWYSCIQPVSPYPSLFINAKMIRFRANKWLGYAYGIEGELYYMANRTQAHDFEIDIPKTEEEILAGEAIYEGTYGDGLLMYPVHSVYGKVDPSIYYIPSIRLLNISEGADDYNYLAYAGELINAISDSSTRSLYKQRLSSIINNVSSSPVGATVDGSVLIRERNNLASLIVELQTR